MDDFVCHMTKETFSQKEGDNKTEWAMYGNKNDGYSVTERDDSSEAERNKAYF